MPRPSLAGYLLRMSVVKIRGYAYYYMGVEIIIRLTRIKVARITRGHAVWIPAARGRMSTCDYSSVCSIYKEVRSNVANSFL